MELSKTTILFPHHAPISYVHFHRHHGRFGP
jgi:hypothetical protein